MLSSRIFNFGTRIITEIPSEYLQGTSVAISKYVRNIIDSPPEYNRIATDFIKTIILFIFEFFYTSLLLL